MQRRDLKQVEEYSEQHHQQLQLRGQSVATDVPSSGNIRAYLPPYPPNLEVLEVLQHARTPRDSHSDDLQCDHLTGSAALHQRLQKQTADSPGAAGKFPLLP